MGFKVSELRKKIPTAYKLHTAQFTDCNLSDTPCSFAIVKMAKDDVLIIFMKEIMCMALVLQDSFTLPMKILPKELIRFSKEQILAVMIEGQSVIVGMSHSTVLTLTASSQRARDTMYEKFIAMLVSTGRRMERTVQMDCQSLSVQMAPMSINQIQKVVAPDTTALRPIQITSKRDSQTSLQANKQVKECGLTDVKIDLEENLAQQCAQYQQKIVELEKVTQELSNELVKARLYNLEIQQLLKEQQEYIGWLYKKVVNLKNVKHIDYTEKSMKCEKCEGSKRTMQQLNQAYRLSKTSEERLLHELENLKRFYETRIKQLGSARFPLKSKQLLESQSITHLKAIQCNTVKCITIECDTVQCETFLQGNAKCETVDCGIYQGDAVKFAVFQSENLKCRTVQCDTFYCKTVECETLECGTFQCGTVERGIFQCKTVECSPLQWDTETKIINQNQVGNNVPNSQQNRITELQETSFQEEAF